MKTIKELFKHSIINPENIVIRSIKGVDTKYTLSFQMEAVCHIEIIVINIKNCSINTNIANIVIRKTEIDNYPMPKLVKQILKQCNKDANKLVVEEWEEVFEDELNCILKLDCLVKKYLKWYSKVKISAKMGKIVIEKLEK